MLVFLCRLSSSYVNDGTMHFFYETSELPAFYLIYFSFCVDLGAKTLLSPNSLIEAVKPVISLCYQSCQFRDEDDVFLAKTTDFFFFCWDTHTLWILTLAILIPRSGILNPEILISYPLWTYLTPSPLGYSPPGHTGPSGVTPPRIKLRNE